MDLDRFAQGPPDRQEDPDLGACSVCGDSVFQGDEQIDGLNVIHAGRCWRTWCLAKAEERHPPLVGGNYYRNRLAAMRG